MPQVEPLSPRAVVSKRSVAEAKAAEGGHMLFQNEREVLRLLQVLADQSTETHSRAEAAQALGRIPESDKSRRSRVSTALCSALRDDEASGVRVAAAHALEMFCERRDVLTIQALAAGLSDREGLVRRSCAQALGGLAPRDRHASNRLLSVLKTDKDPGVRTQTADALSRVATPGDSDVVSALVTRVIRDDSVAVRRVVIDALAILAKPGDQQVVDTLLAHMYDDSSASASVHALGCLSNRGDAQVVQVIQEYLVADEASLRRIAVEALAKVTADVGEDQLIALLDLVLDSDSCVRFAAAEALRQLAATAPPEAATTLLARLEGSGVFMCQNVRRHLDEGGAEDCDTRLSSLLLDWMSETRSSLVRFVMIQALAHVGRKGDPKIVESLVPNLKDSDGAVRAATAQALGCLATRGDQDVVAALCAWLKDPDPPVRRTTAVALGNLALEGDQICSNALWFLLKDENDAVRSAATRAMRKINATISSPQRCLNSSQQPKTTHKRSIYC